MRLLVKGTHSRGYILAGDIPYPYPKEGWIVGYDWSYSGSDFREVQAGSWVQCPVCLKVDIAGEINDWPGTTGSKGNPGCGCLGILSVTVQESILGSRTEKALFEASEEENYQLSEALDRIFKRNIFLTTSETTLLRDAYYAARQARFDRRDPPLSPEEKALRVRTEWRRIIIDLQDKGEEEAATYFDWLEVVGFTGNTLELAATKNMANIAAKSPATFRKIGEASELLKPLLASVSKCSRVQADRITVSPTPRD
jgi:hypothetical protein